MALKKGKVAYSLLESHQDEQDQYGLLPEPMVEKKAEKKTENKALSDITVAGSYLHSPEIKLGP